MLYKKWRKPKAMLTPRRSYGKDLSKGKLKGKVCDFNKAAHFEMDFLL